MPCPASIAGQSAYTSSGCDPFGRTPIQNLLGSALIGDAKYINLDSPLSRQKSERIVSLRKPIYLAARRPPPWHAAVDLENCRIVLLILGQISL
jgi:hypothetical protein